MFLNEKFVEILMKYEDKENLNKIKKCKVDFQIMRIWENE